MTTAKSVTSIAATAALLAMSSVAMVSSAQAAPKQVHCFGVNSCKGTSDCKSYNHDCKGQNSCKGQDLCGFIAQGGVGNQIEPQQRTEHAQRVGGQRSIADRAKCGRMHRHAGGRQIVITDRLHAHDCKGTRQRRQFLRRADANRTVTFGLANGGLPGARVDLRDQRQQVGIERHFLPVHGRQRRAKASADGIGIDEIVRHCDDPFARAD